MKESIAYANANIALVKYWGKSNEELNIPIVPSLSMTLNNFGSTSSIKKNYEDKLILNGQNKNDDSFIRLKKFLDYIRKTYRITDHFLIESSNNIPTKAGLASSSSAYASISLAINNLLSLNLDEKNLSILARIGSASAARSITGKISILYGGNIKSEESYSETITNQQLSDLVVLIAVCDEAPKKISSRDGMNNALSSPFFNKFVKESHTDLKEALSSIKTGNFVSLGKITQYSTIKMHSVMWTSNPCINYWIPKSLEVVKKVQEIQDNLGFICFFTLDAGPNVKIFCQEKNRAFIKKELLKLISVTNLIESTIGGKAYVKNI
jgi:diphosphomevalonate decarboxylase